MWWLLLGPAGAVLVAEIARRYTTQESRQDDTGTEPRTERPPVYFCPACGKLTIHADPAYVPICQGCGRNLTDVTPLELPPKLIPRLRRWLERFAEKPSPATEPVPEPSSESTDGLWRRLLSPTVLLALLSLGLGGALLVYTQAPSTVTHYAYLACLGAVVGLGTNWLAIKMLFHPREPRWWLGNWQGVIPANRDQIIDALAQGIRDNILDPETIREAIHESDLVKKALDEWLRGIEHLASDPVFQEDLHELIEGYTLTFVADARLRAELIERIAALARNLLPETAGLQELLGEFVEGLVRNYREPILAEIDTQARNLARRLAQRLQEGAARLPGWIETHRDELEGWLSEQIASRVADIDIADVIRERLKGYDTDAFEALLLEVTDQHLAAIQILGAVLGAIAVPLVEWLLPG